ncbi:MAG TPA: hypothetical protein VE622_00835 [Nitrososphaeraceae archaeon]|nr:hypothetical protein [Nitrososphaeraceae archaeon]
MSNAFQQINDKSKQNVVELVYSIINNHGGKATRKYIEEEIHPSNNNNNSHQNSNNKYIVRYAILRLLREGKIKRVRGFGPKGIEYYYVSIT